MTDCKNLELARQWAADIDADRQTLSQDTIDAAVEVIRDLPDEWVDADDVRRFVADWRDGLTTAPRGNYEGEMLDDLEALLPAPPAPRTMNEIEWDDAEHHLAEALLGDTWKVVMLARDTDEEGDWSEWIHCRAEDGSTDLIEKAHLTPTGRKYRLEPEDDTPTSPIEDEPAPESAAPRPEDVPVGEAWQVEVDGQEVIGYRNDPEARLCWAVVHPYDAGHRWICDADVTLVARLVPETTEQDDEPVFDPAFVYRDNHGDVWRYSDEAWWCFQQKHDTFRAKDTPPAEYGPYTRIEDTK